MSQSHPRPVHEANSFTVEMRGRRPMLISSGWIPGYTEAHCETPSLAIENALKRNAEAIQKLEMDRQELEAMLAAAVINERQA